MITGEGAMTKDLIETATTDFQVTNAISIAAILLIVGLCFHSVSVPIILVAAIELSIFINVGISYLTGAVIPFISPTVIGCIQLGATVDYAILMTTRFREELRNGQDKREAIAIAATAADPAIISSSLVLFCATFGVSVISKIEIIQSICLMLARGAIVSALVSIFILPSVLLASEGLIAKTSRNWRTAPVKRERKRKKNMQGSKPASAKI
jgi:predicted RND superfamily exporter protein